MNRRAIAGMVLLAAVATTGCNSNTTNDSGGSARQAEPTELVAMSRPPVPDLPVPIGFDLDQGRSRNLAAAGVRWVDHVYKGSGDKFAVARFYRRQMPINRWVLVTEMFSKGDLKLDFEKQNERCHITLSDGDVFHATIIRTELWTAGRVPQPQSPPQAPSPKESNP
jgi:hypothetical protein